MPQTWLSKYHPGLGASISTLPRVAADKKRSVNIYTNYDEDSTNNGVFTDLVIQPTTSRHEIGIIKTNSITETNRIQTIDTIAKARIALEKMNKAPVGTVFACDTEVSEIDLKTQGKILNVQ